MQRISKTLLSLVLFSLMLSWVSGRARPFHPRRAGHRQGHAAGQAALRLRRWRERAPGHAPVHPSLIAVFGSDDDDDHGKPRPCAKDAHHLPVACGRETSRFASHTCPGHLSRKVPLHQMLCHLQI